MSNNWQLALGRNTPTTVSAAPGLVNISDPTYLDIGGGTIGQVLTSKGGSLTYWALPSSTGGADAPADGGLYARKNAAWVHAVAQAGDTMTGPLYLPSATPTLATQATSKAYVDAAPNQAITLSGDVTGSGTAAIPVTLAATAVIPGSYTYAAITVDAKGRLTSAANGAPPSVIADGTSVTGAGTVASPLSVQTIDCGTY